MVSKERDEDAEAMVGAQSHHDYEVGRGIWTPTTLSSSNCLLADIQRAAFVGRY